MAKMPTTDEWEEKIGNKVLNEYVYEGRILKEWIDLMASGKLVILPNNATNGDVIKALFPNAEFDNAMPFTDNRWETMNLDTENKIRAMYKPTQLRTYADWWNAPYKAEGSERECR